jgi:hypothetical protein
MTDATGAIKRALNRPPRGSEQSLQIRSLQERNGYANPKMTSIRASPEDLGTLTVILVLAVQNRSGPQSSKCQTPLQSWSTDSNLPLALDTD